MTTLILVALLLCAPLTCHAAMSQSECPPDTIWNSSVNQCYPDPNAPSVIKAREEEEKARREAERLKEEQRLEQEREELRRRGYPMPFYQSPAPANQH